MRYPAPPVLRRRIAVHSDVIDSVIGHIPRILLTVVAATTTELRPEDDGGDELSRDSCRPRHDLPRRVRRPLSGGTPISTLSVKTPKSKLKNKN
jgi:hypothetical protein